MSVFMIFLGVLLTAVGTYSYVEENSSGLREKLQDSYRKQESLQGDKWHLQERLTSVQYELNHFKSQQVAKENEYKIKPRRRQ